MPPTKGALPPSALRLPPPRSPRGRGAWRAGFALLHAPYHQALVATASIKGAATPEMLTRSVLGLRPALRVRLPLSPLTLSYAQSGTERGSSLMGPAKRGGKPFMLDALGVTQRLRLGVGLRSVATPAPHPDDRGRLVPPSGGRRGENATSETRRRA